MAAITVSAGTIELYQGVEATLKMRVYVKKNFVTSDLESIVKGRLHSSDFYRTINCTALGGIVSYPQFVIDSTTDGTPNSSYYIFQLYTNAGVAIGTPVHKKIKVPPTPTSTTLGALAIFTALTPVAITDAYYALLVALIGAMMRATTTVFGVLKTSYASLSAGEPIAVENNDPVIRQLRETVYLETYNQAGLTAAIAAIGATAVNLKITNPITISSNTTTHANTNVVIEGNGAFSVNSLITLTVKLDPSAPRRQIFSGLGDAIVTTGDLHFEWWAGRVSSGNCNWAFAQLKASLTASQGGKWEVGPGTWHVDDAFMPEAYHIIGRGAGSNVDGLYGTKFTYATITATCVMGVSEGYRGVQFHDMTFDRGASTTARAFWIKGTYPNSAFALQMSNCVFRGTATSSVKILEIDSLPGATEWETIGIHFDHCSLAVPDDSVGFTCDSINTSILWTQPSFFCSSVGATAMDMMAFGWMKIIQGDWRGINPLTPAPTVIDRMVDGTIGLGLDTLTLTSGQFVENDIGQKIFRAGSIDARIIDITSNTTAIISIVAAAGASAAPIEIHRFQDHPDMADSCIKLNSSFGGLQIDNGADEGFNHFLKTTNSTLFGAVHLTGLNIQSRIHFGGTRTVIMEGNTLFSQTFSDEVGVTSRIFGRNMVHSASALGLGHPGATLVKARNWGIHDGGSVFYTEQDIQTGAHDYLHGPLPYQQFNYPLRLANPTGGTGAMLEIGSDSAAIVEQLRIGQTDPWSKEFVNYYDLGRQGADVGVNGGRFRLWGNQIERYRGWDTNFDHTMTTFNLGQEPTTITADGTFISTTRAYLQKFTCTGIKHIRGFASMPFDLGYRLGEHKRFLNVGTGTLVLTHQDPLVDPGAGPTETDDFYKFQTATGLSIYLAPGEAAEVFRDDAIGPWRVIKIPPPPLIAYLAATETYNNTAALADTPLVLPVDALGIYDIELTVHSTSAVVGLKLDFGGTATITNFIGQWTANGISDPLSPFAASRVTAAGTDFQPTGPDGVDTIYRFIGSVEVNAAGTFLLRGAQNAANASNTTILRGSTMKLTKTN